MPFCYGRIYKALLQHQGRSAIPGTIRDLEKGDSKEEILTRIKGIKFSHDVWWGIHQLFFMQMNNRLEFLHRLTTKEGITPLFGSLDTVLLQLVPSDRWARRFKHDKPTYDLILAVPKWSRVVSLSTSDISPPELLQSIRQFDTLQLNGYDFYDFFNKLHGQRGRTVTVESKDNQGRVKNLARLSYLFRSCADLRMISQSGNLRLFTMLPDTKGELRIGMFFMMVCKIGDVRETPTADGRGINPSGFMVALSDQTGTVDARLNTSPQRGSMWRNLADGYMQDEINGNLVSGTADAPTFGHPLYTFGHPLDLEKHDGSFLVMGSWFLGDDNANVIFATPLSTSKYPDVVKKFSMLSYMNTRKRVQVRTLSKDCGLDERHLALPQETKNLQELGVNVKPEPYSVLDLIALDSEREWAYYIEQHWDKGVILFILQNNLKIPTEFSKIVGCGIPVQKFNAHAKEIIQFFRINDELKNLYLPGGKGLDEIYKPLETYESITVPKGLSKHIKSPNPRDIERILNLVQVTGWKNVNRLCVGLKEHGFSTDEIFRWGGNGGRPLEDGWEKLRLKNWRIENDKVLAEIRSALSHIYQASGMVFVPEMVYEESL
jgi:hypothetical protein